MLSNKEIVCPNNLLDVAHKKKGVKAAIVNAGKPLPMLSVQDAVNESLIIPIFIGDKNEILKCAEQLKWDISSYEIINETVENKTAAIAAKLASKNKVKIIVKGHIHTDILMKEVLKREYNQLGKTRLSHIWHMTTTKDDGPLIITDGALNVLPNIKTKMHILRNVIDFTNRIGIKNDVAGLADVLLVPSVETGNGLVKMLIYFSGACAAGVVVGGKVPVVITSRSDEAQARLASIAAAVVALD